MSWLEQVLENSRDCPLGGICSSDACKRGCYDMSAAAMLSRLNLNAPTTARAYQSVIGHLPPDRQKRIIKRIKTSSELNSFTVPDQDC